MKGKGPNRSRSEAGKSRIAVRTVRRGLPFTEQWQRYIAFDLATSLGWDTGRAVTNFVCVLLAGPAVLTTFRRAARKARFRAPVRFADPRTAESEPG